MRKIGVMVFLVLWFTSAAAQSGDPPCKPTPRPDWERDGFLGRVKQVKTFKTWYPSGTRELEEDASYDRKGNQIDWKNTNYLPVDPGDEVVVEYDCDSSNRIAEMRYKRVRDSSFRKAVYKYDDKGRYLEQANYFEDGTLERLETYSYDDKGNRIEQIEKQQVHPEHFTPKRYDVYVTTRATYEFDDRRNKIKEFHFTTDGSFYAVWSFQFDSQNRLIKELRVDKIGRLEEEFVYKYDRNGKLREEWHYENFCYERNGEMCKGSVQSGGGLFYYLTKTTYTYDRTGNWIREQQFSMGGEENTNRFALDYTLSRQIKYY